MPHTLLQTSATCVVLVAAVLSHTARSADPQDTLLTPQLRERAKGTKPWPATGPQLLRAALKTAPKIRGNLTVSGERPKGDAATVYQGVAPAVVVVRTSSGYGTGWVVDPEGWIVTNHHVIDDGEIDEATLARKSTVYLGEMRDGYMQLDTEAPGVPALVYKAIEGQDLALLKLVTRPTTALPHLQLAEKLPPAGIKCFAVGHPRASVLWSIREGITSGIGKMPEDIARNVLSILVMPEEERESLQAELARNEQQQVLISTCGVNHGDSGGPLVDEAGKVIAVTFAAPADPDDNKFTFHVHLDQVRKFLERKPSRPEIEVPDAWPTAMGYQPLDLDEDGTVDALAGYVVTEEEKQNFTGILIDLDQNSPATDDTDDLSAEQFQKRWEFEFAEQLEPRHATFYDTDNNGQIDVILQAMDEPESVLEWTNKQGEWHGAKLTSAKLVAPERFKDPAIRKRLIALRPKEK